MNEDYTKLPDNLPKPDNYEEADHLLGMTIPGIILSSTKGQVDLSKINAQHIVLYFFTMMSVPEKSLP